MAVSEPVQRPQAGHDLRLTRVFHAPRAVVFRAWTDPAQVAVWWGPNGFTNPRCEWEARPGGAIHIDMRGPDGTVYPMSGRFEEVTEPERLVFISAALDARGVPMFEIQNTITFAELPGGRTELTVSARVLGSTDAAAPYLAGAEIGWSQQMERLRARLAEEGDESTAGRDIVATRVFAAPRDLVWRMWTEAEHVAQWWGPHGFTNTIHQMDVRPGGLWHLTMHGPDGRDYDNKIVYDEVSKPERLVYTHASAPLFQSTATFIDLGGKTQVTVRMVFETAALRNQVVEEYHAAEGLKQDLEKLEHYIAKL